MKTVFFTFNAKGEASKFKIDVTHLNLPQFITLSCILLPLIRLVTLRNKNVYFPYYLRHAHIQHQKSSEEQYSDEFWNL